MPGRPLLRLALTLALGVVAVGGCGGASAPRDPPLRGAALTIYSSVPQRGPLRVVAADVLDAERLALDHDGGRVGRYRVRLVALDASTPGLRRSDPAQISLNARRAAQDPTAIAYLGELATGTSAISIPLLNEAGILEVSPLDTAMALTTASPAVAGSPVRYYPKLKVNGRTFARVVPSDRGEAGALLAGMRADGVRRLAILTDEDPTGRSIANDVQADAHAAGIAVVAQQEIEVQDRTHEGAVAQVVQARPDAALDATGARPGAALLWRELHAADPRLQLYAPSSLADPSFAAGLGAAAPVAHVTAALPGASAAPARAVDRFEREFVARFARTPAPEARFGYEAMRGVLSAIRRAELRAPDGLLTRRTVTREYFRTKVASSLIGPYAIDGAGDTTLGTWGAFAVVGGRLRYDGAVA